MLSETELLRVWDAGVLAADDGKPVLAGLRAVEAAGRADTLQEFAETLRERYPEDVFPKPNDENYHALNVALAWANIALDRFSADLMRRAAAQADAEAAAIRAQLEGTTGE